MKYKSLGVYVRLIVFVLISLFLVGELLAWRRRIARVQKPHGTTQEINTRLEPNRYFTAKKDLEICKAISENNLARLLDLLTAHDINSSGKDGVSFLFWAWMTNNLDAFKFLLLAGADPDLTVKDEIRSDLEIFAMAGDSVLFASLGYRRGGDFLEAALNHTKNSNQVDAGGYNLIHRYFSVGATAQGFNRLDLLIASGIDLNKPSPNDETVCEMAIKTIHFNHNSTASECIKLLEAGAPTEFSGRSLYSRVCGSPELVEIKAWLESHGRGSKLQN